MEYFICDIHIKVKIKGTFVVGLIETFDVIQIVCILIFDRCFDNKSNFIHMDMILYGLSFIFNSLKVQKKKANRVYLRLDESTLT